MSKIAKKCEECKHFRRNESLPYTAPGVCMYPPIVHTFPNGRDVVESRQPGRFCGPEGACYKPLVVRA